MTEPYRSHVAARWPSTAVPTTSTCGCRMDTTWIPRLFWIRRCGSTQRLAILGVKWLGEYAAAAQDTASVDAGSKDTSPARNAWDRAAYFSRFCNSWFTQTRQGGLPNLKSRHGLGKAKTREVEKSRQSLHWKCHIPDMPRLPRTQAVAAVVLPC